MAQRVRWTGNHYEPSSRRKRIGQAIGRNLPMPVCRFLNWAAQRWAPGLWQDAVKEAEEAKAQAEYHAHLDRKHADPYDGFGEPQ